MIGIDFASPPKEAIEYLDKKDYRLSFHYNELMREQHHKAFTVAKVTKLDLLNDIHKSLVDSANNGTGFTEWKKNLKPTLQKQGWLGKTDVVDPRSGEIETINVNSRRLRTIYQTNMQVSYQVSRTASMRELDFAVYWVYKSAMRETSREKHKVHHNHAYHRDDPFWSTWNPKNGWNCLCDKIAVTKGECKRMGYKLNEPYTPNDDEDWAYNVGETDINAGVTDGLYSKSIEALNQTQTGEWGQTWKKEFVEQVLEVSQEAVDVESYKKWIETFYNADGTRNPKPTTPINTMVVGAMNIRVFDYFAKKGNTPSTASITLSKNDFTHATRGGTKTDLGKAVTKEQALCIPDALKTPQKIAWDKNSGNILYFFDLNEVSGAYMVISANYKKDKRHRNAVVSANIIPRANVEGGDYEWLP